MLSLNAADVNVMTLRARHARDFQDGYRRFWKGEPSSYCANAAERAGYFAAADEDAADYRRHCDEGNFVRSLGH